MADEPDDTDAAADRLEAALERIAYLASTTPAAATPIAPAAAKLDETANRGDADLSIPEIAERLDTLIARLRAALGDGAKSD